MDYLRYQPKNLYRCPHLKERVDKEKRAVKSHIKEVPASVKSRDSSMWQGNFRIPFGDWTQVKMAVSICRDSMVPWVGSQRQTRSLHGDDRTITMESKGTTRGPSV